MPSSTHDPRRTVIEYIARRKCAQCGASVDGVRVTDLRAAELTPCFRCYPPAPTCWEFNCPNCHVLFTFAERKGKAWPLDSDGNAGLTRRVPQRRRRGGAKSR